MCRQVSWNKKKMLVVLVSQAHAITQYQRAWDKLVIGLPPSRASLTNTEGSQGVSPHDHPEHVTSLSRCGRLGHSPRCSWTAPSPFLPIPKPTLLGRPWHGPPSSAPVLPDSVPHPVEDNSVADRADLTWQWRAPFPPERIDVWVMHQLQQIQHSPYPV